METSRFFNWVKEYGWRHLIALIFVTFAVYPILFVATNSIADFANLTNSKLIPDGLTLKHYKLLSSDPLVPYFIIFPHFRMYYSKSPSNITHSWTNRGK